MKKRPWLVLTLAIACGGLASYLTASGMQSPAPVEDARSALREIAVAARDLPAGTILQAEDLRTIPWSGDALPAGFIGGTDDLVGQGLLMGVQANEPLLRTKLVGKGSSGGLPLIIPEGMRAMSVAVDEVVAVAGFVVPGTRVDVLVTAHGDDAPASTRLILQNVQVLASGQTIEPDQQGKPQTSSVITLLVTPAESEQLALASSEGKIQLALRNTLDRGRAVTTGSTLASLTIREVPPGVAARPTPPRARASRATTTSIEIYHGGKRSVEVF